MILLGVVAVLLVSFASSLRAYVDQQAQLDDLQSQITASKAAIKDLERDKGRYADDAYLIAQARERFTFAFPGEIGYQVIGTDGQPLDRQEMLPEATSLDVERLQWWERTVTSLKEAGRRPLPGQDQPVKRLTVPPRLP